MTIPRYERFYSQINNFQLHFPIHFLNEAVNTMDSKALLHDESHSDMYYDEISTSEDGLSEKGARRLVSKTSIIKQLLRPTLLCGFITLIYSFVLVVVVLKMQALRLQGPALIYCKLSRRFCHASANADTAPAREALQYEAHVFDMNPHIQSPYFGEPSDELDEAWNDLLQC